MITLAEQTAIAIVSSAVFAGIAFGVVKGSIADHREQIRALQEEMQHKICEGRCTDKQNACRHEVLASLEDLKKGQERILNHLLNGKG